MKHGLALAFFCSISAPVLACTIFVLTDAKRALFCNNEDWSNPKSRIWFVPAGEGHWGCAYVGFDDGQPQGGVNTEGLAFDWVAGFMEKWEPIPDREPDVTKHLYAIVEDMFGGTVRPGDYTADFWKEFYPNQKELQADLKRLGGFISMTLVARWDEDGWRNYRYRTEFANATLLQHYVLDKQNKVALIQSDDIESK